MAYDPTALSLSLSLSASPSDAVRAGPVTVMYDKDLTALIQILCTIHMQKE